MMPFIQIVLQGILYLFAKVDDCLVTAFAAYFNAVILEIHIADIESDAFRDTNAGSQQKCQECYISCLGDFMETLLCRSQSSAVLYLI